MKPYIAILIDSFWEAVSSRVLWALLIGWTILLLGIAPFGYIVERNYQLSDSDIRYNQGLAQKLAKGLTSAGSASQRAVSERLTPAFQEKLRKYAGKNEPGQQRQNIRDREIASELNKLLKDRTLYSEEVFTSASRLTRLKDITSKSVDERSDEEVEKLNRELIQLVYSADLQSPRSEQLYIGYAGIKLNDSALPFNKAQVRMFVERIALEAIIRLGLSFVAVFVGLIITSPMIPETFRSGSLHLLLSKPISRSLVYLTKVLGGTAFVLVNIAYLLVGLFLIVGWRLEIWNPGLLACIPLLLFVFLIFYSVSALVGVIWNNPIICVVTCIVFWAFCGMLGVVESAMRVPTQMSPRIARFQVVDDNLLAVTHSGVLKVWNEQFQIWQPVGDARQPFAGRVLGPVLDKSNNRLVFRSDFLDGFGNYATNDRRFTFADLGETGKRSNASDEKSAEDKAAVPTKEPEVAIDAPKTMDEARRKSRWTYEKKIEPPPHMIELLLLDDKAIAITRNGFFEINWRAVELSEAIDDSGVWSSLSSLVNRLKPSSFQDITPPDYIFGDRVRVSAASTGSRFSIYNNGSIDALKWNATNKKLEVVKSVKLEGDERTSTLLADNGSMWAVAREEGVLYLIDSESGQKTQEYQLPDNVDVRQLQAIPDCDLFSVLTHNDELFLLDPKATKLSRVECSWQGKISGVTWIDPDHVWVAVKPQMAVLLNVKDGKTEKQLQPRSSRIELVYDWIARPLYVFNPKPSSLNGVLQTLLSREPTGQTQLANNDLSTMREDVEIWQPLITNLIFVLVVLGIGCIYVTRREF